MITSDFVFRDITSNNRTLRDVAFYSIPLQIVVVVDDENTFTSFDVSNAKNFTQREEWTNVPHQYKKRLRTNANGAIFYVDTNDTLRVLRSSSDESDEIASGVVDYLFLSDTDMLIYQIANQDTKVILYDTNRTDDFVELETVSGRQVTEVISGDGYFSFDSTHVRIFADDTREIRTLLRNFDGVETSWIFATDPETIVNTDPFVDVNSVQYDPSVVIRVRDDNRVLVRSTYDRYISPITDALDASTIRDSIYSSSNDTVHFLTASRAFRTSQTTTTGFVEGFERTDDAILRGYVGTDRFGREVAYVFEKTGRVLIFEGSYFWSNVRVAVTAALVASLLPSAIRRSLNTYIIASVLGIATGTVVNFTPYNLPALSGAASTVVAFTFAFIV